MIVLKFGELAKEARENRGWSQATLWKRLVAVFGENAVSLDCIKKVETGRRPQSITRKQITRVLPELRQ